MCFFFFFKQKTAYEMRISDWSSDVCSSDLHLPNASLAIGQCKHSRPADQHRLCPEGHRLDYVTAATNAAVKHDHSLAAYRLYDFGKNEQGSWCMIQSAAAMIGYNNAVRTAKNSFAGIVWRQNRSEEHTSELQSLMRISYAVFCLKKKKNK